VWNPKKPIEIALSRQKLWRNMAHCRPLDTDLIQVLAAIELLPLE